jgi:hypothetical protein
MAAWCLLHPSWTGNESQENIAARLLNAPASPAPGATLQARVQPWMQACFGAEISADRIERNLRFIEEGLELVQACGCTRDEAHQLVEYVYGRPVGDVHQEVGGVMVTLAALCLANDIDMHAAGEDELARVWTKVDAIRAKQAAKPRGSALPEYVAADRKDAGPAASAFAFTWLVEAPGQKYLAARQIPLSREEFHWTSDHNAALRFVSREQADMTMMAVRQLAPHLFGFAVTLGEARAVEHGWLVDLTPPKADEWNVARPPSEEPF